MDYDLDLKDADLHFRKRVMIGAFAEHRMVGYGIEAVFVTDSKGQVQVLDIAEGDGNLEFQFSEEMKGSSDRKQGCFIFYSEPNQKGEIA